MTLRNKTSGAAFCFFNVKTDAIDGILDVVEYEVRKRFYHIINGEGITIPRIAVKCALDDIFSQHD